MRHLWKFIKELTHRLMVAVGAVALTAAFFLVLPLIQAITKPPAPDMTVQSVDIAAPPPPPPPPEEPPPEDPEPDDKPPELTDDAPPLDLSQIELVLNPGMGAGGLLADMNNKLRPQATSNVDELFSLADLDQRPRVVYQPSPLISAQLRNAAPGMVYIVFIVDQNGRVQNTKVQKSSNPIFEGPAIKAVRKWRFEPGKRNGEAVRFRMRVPISFPKG